MEDFPFVNVQSGALSQGYEVTWWTASLALIPIAASGPLLFSPHTSFRAPSKPSTQRSCEQSGKGAPKFKD